MQTMCYIIVEAVSLQPLDVAKTRMQLDKVGKYKGFYQTGTTIVREEGGRALYKGLTPFVAHLTAKYALRMYTFTVCQRLVATADGSSTPLRNMFAGLISGVTEAVLVVTPFEVIKTRLQQQHGMDMSKLKYKGSLHCLTTVVKEEGPSALLKGVVPTMVRQGSNQAANFWAVKLLNQKLWDKVDGDGKKLPIWQTLVSGMIGGAAGPISNCPSDVVKTRLMSQVIVPGKAPKYTGFIQALGVIAREEGIAALYKGLGVRLARVAPGQAIMWAVVSRITSSYEQYEIEKIGAGNKIMAAI
jgi:solute carrier family 25 citrate transporter 1